MSARLPSVELTRMLQAWSGGDTAALEILTPIVYGELHRIAQRNLARERDGHLLQPSALVNETFLRLMGDAPVDWKDRTQFFAFSARIMRQILIDFARAEETVKRGQRSPHVDLSAAAEVAAVQFDLAGFIDLDQALADLAKLDARQAHLVELRYFGGLENAEIASVLGVSEPTVVREWRAARAWLCNRLQESRPGAARLP